MNARHLLLTHFSGRYPKLPPLTGSCPVDLSAESIEPTVAIAFDLATLRLDKFWKMGNYQEPMDLLFGWDEEEEEDEGSGNSPQCRKVDWSGACKVVFTGSNNSSEHSKYLYISVLLLLPSASWHPSSDSPPALDSLRPA